MRIRLTESDLHMMVMETIKRVLKENVFDEAVMVSEPKEGAVPVNIMVGRFQPFTIGHLECLKQAAQKTGRKTMVFVSKGSPDPKKNKPIYGDVQDEMISRIKNGYSDIIADIVYGNGAAIDINVARARLNGYEPISWVTGKDHETAYRNMVKIYGEQLKLRPDFEVTILDRDPDSDDVTGVSATKVREAILNGNKKEFLRMVPAELHDMYDAFREILISK